MFYKEIECIRSDLTPFKEFKSDIKCSNIGFGQEIHILELVMFRKFMNTS